MSATLIPANVALSTVQTSVEPPSGNSALRTRLEPLWMAIQEDSLATGRAIFFPESAYVRMKTGEIPDPPLDFNDRLMAFFGLDIGAYHSALGAQPKDARLLSVDANPAYASWIAPGACENSVGYWHLPGARIVYATPTGTRSFAVASLISWRGLWYVVHLGPNPRPVNVGTVDLPAAGPGTPGPPGGC